MSETCPECGAPNPPPIKVCASVACRKEFRRSEAGRADAKYCSRACAQSQAARNFRWREVASELGLPAPKVAQIVYESMIMPGTQDDPEAVLAHATQRLSMLTEADQAGTARIRMRFLKQIELAMAAPADDRQRPLRRAATRLGHRMVALAMEHHTSAINAYLFGPVDRLTDAQLSRETGPMVAAVRTVLDAADGIPVQELPSPAALSQWEHDAWEAVEFLRAIYRRDWAAVSA